MTKAKPKANGKEPKLTLKLLFLVKQTGGEFCALCPDLDIASCGTDEEEAIKSLKGLIELYVIDCLESGLSKKEIYRPTPREALEEFLTPRGRQGRSPIISRRIPMAITPSTHAYA